MAAGPPEEVARSPRSFAGHFLAPLLHVTPEQVPAPAPTSKARGRKARTDGEVAYAELVRNTTHPDVDRALLEAARDLRFRPARVGREPVDAWVEQPAEVRVGDG